MATEIELKLKLTVDIARQLPSHPLLTGLTPQILRLYNTYYDTPDLALHRQRIALRFRKKGPDWLLTVKSAEPASGGLSVRNEWECPAQPGVFNFTHVDDVDLRRLLTDQFDTFQAIFTTHFRRTLWQVPFGESLIEVAVDRGSIQSRDNKARIAEMELELLHGRIADLFALVQRLQRDFPLQALLASKAERGYDLYQPRPLSPSHQAPLTALPGNTPIAAFRHIALGCLHHFQCNTPGLTMVDAPEFVHQARVALRRMNAAMALFKPLLPIHFVTRYSRAWRALGRALGEIRDRDVLAHSTLPPLREAFPDARDLQRLIEFSQRQPRTARRHLIPLFEHDDAHTLLLDFTGALYALNESSTVDLAEWAKTRLAGLEQRIRQHTLEQTLDTARQRHALRLKIKRLRYACEFFQPLIATTEPTPDRANYLQSLIRLQNHLGQLNDLACARQLLTTADIRCPRAFGWLAGQEALLCRQLPAQLKPWLAESLFSSPPATTSP